MSNKGANRLFNRAARLRALGSIAPKFHFGLWPFRIEEGDAFIGLPFKRSWVFTLISGVFFAAFCIPYFTIGPMFGEMASDSLFGLIFILFNLFWLLGWTVGVCVLGLVFLCTLFGRESLHIRPGKVLLRLELLGLGVGVDYSAQAIENLRREAPDVASGSQWRGEHLAFDYGGESIRFGSDIDESRAVDIFEAIKNIAIASAAPLTAVSVEPQITRQVASEKPVVVHSPELPMKQANLSSVSTQALIIANLIPLVGVVAYDWSIGEVMLLFWSESAFIGFYNLLKMWVVGRWSILMLGPFFVGHYGGFMSVHLLFIYALFQGGLENADTSVSTVFSDFFQLWPALLGLFISHGISYRQNFLRRQEYLGKTINNQMGEPYKRIIVMHVTIIFGGFMTMIFSSPLLALVLLILLKIIVDVKGHLDQRKRQAKTQAA